MTILRALTLAAVLTASDAAADPISGTDAKALLFAENGVSVELLPNDKLPADLMKVIRAVAEQQPW